MLADNADRHLYGGPIDQVSARRCSLIKRRFGMESCFLSLSQPPTRPTPQKHASEHHTFRTTNALISVR